jgi:hypothetical protein
MTDFLPTDAALRLTQQSSTEGGGRIVGATDNAGQMALTLYGLCPNNAVATVRNMQFVAAGGNGTGIQTVAADKITHAFYNNTTELFHITGDGRGVSQFTAKAWVNFNGTGTVAVRDSHNISSIGDGGVGTYVLNFSNNMGNVNYSTVVSCDWPSWDSKANLGTPQVHTNQVYTMRGDSSNYGLEDNAKVAVVIFGD